MCKLCSRFRNNWNDDERLDGIDFSCIEENGNVRDPRTKKSKVTQNLSTDQKEAKPDPLSLSDRLAAEDCQTLQRNRLPCVILTVFLGSGKTTLLNHILRTSSLKLAVIENEVGEQAIDEKLLETKDDKNSLDTTTEVVLMPNGCLCCRVRGDLVKALKDITNRKESKQLEGIILEMSGLSSLAPVVQTFFANDFVQAHICLDSVICVVDATQAPRLLKMADDKEGLLIREQLSLADLVLVNKIDALQNATDSEMLTTAINQINHTTKTIKCSLRADDMEIIKKLKSHMFTRFNSFSLENALKASDALKTQIAGNATTSAKTHDHDILGFTSLSIVISDGAIDYLKLQNCLEESIIKVYPDILVRYKGTLWSKDGTKDVQIIMQGVFGHVEFSHRKDIVSDSDRISTLVFIGSIDRPIDGEKFVTLRQFLLQVTKNCKIPSS